MACQCHPADYTKGYLIAKVMTKYGANVLTGSGAAKLLAQLKALAKAKKAASLAKAEQKTTAAAVRAEEQAEKTAAQANKVEGNKCGNPNGGCFVAGTMILTSFGLKPIEQIEVGDYVLSRDQFDLKGLVYPRQVTEIFSRTSDIQFIEVENIRLGTTSEHPLWVEQEGWQPVRMLKEGSKVAGLESDKYLRIKKIEAETTISAVYNFTVGEAHTFFVGDKESSQHIWVHNNSLPGAPCPTETATPASSLEKASTLEPGPYAKESITARGPERDFTVKERQKINEIGSEHGCHTCGEKSPGTKSGDFVPDHQPPNALNPTGGPQQLYPHCLSCSKRQGGQIRNLQLRGKL